MRNLLCFFILITVISCSKTSTNTNNTSFAIPIGTAVKFEAISSGGGDLQTNYMDSEGNAILKTVPSGWTYTYTATQNKQSTYFGGYPSSGSGNITARIYINGIIKKEAIGGNVVAYYP